MKIRFFLTALVVVISVGAFGQGKPPAAAGGQKMQRGGPGGPGGMRRGMPEELKKQLALTPAQEKKIQAIRDKYQAKMKAAGFTPGAPPAPGKKFDFTKMKPIFDARQKEMDAVYTPKQKVVMDKWRKDHPMRMGGRPGGPGGPGGAMMGAPGRPPKTGGKKGG